MLVYSSADLVKAFVFCQGYVYHNFCSDENKGNVDNPSEFDDKFFLLKSTSNTELPISVLSVTIE